MSVVTVVTSLLVTNHQAQYASAPVQARVPLKTLEKDGKKEAGVLAQCIVIAEQCSALVSEKLAKMPKHELAVNLHTMETEGIALPFEIRTSLLVRRINDLNLDLKAASGEAITKHAQTIAQALSVSSPPDHTCSDVKLQFNNVWAAALAKLEKQVQTGDIAAAEKESELQNLAQAGSVGRLAGLDMRVSCTLSH